MVCKFCYVRHEICFFFRNPVQYSSRGSLEASKVAPSTWSIYPVIEIFYKVTGPPLQFITWRKIWSENNILRYFHHYNVNAKFIGLFIILTVKLYIIRKVMIEPYWFGHLALHNWNNWYPKATALRDMRLGIEGRYHCLPVFPTTLYSPK